MSRPADTTGAQEAAIRGRCACGRRYRIVHATPNAAVCCPQCGRTITITEADLLAAQAGAQFTPVQGDAGLREAILVDCGELTSAPAGSQPGFTGEKFYDHEEAAMAAAMRGWKPATEEYDAPPVAIIGRRPRVVRGFLPDFLLSFACGGVLRNALNLLLPAGVLFGVAIIALLLREAPSRAQVLGGVLSGFAAFLVVVYVLQYFWSVLRGTAAGLERIPWITNNVDIWEDLLKPTLWTAYVTGLGGLPVFLVYLFTPRSGESYVTGGTIALGLGTFLWPVSVLGVALTDAAGVLRLDRVLQAIWSMGAPYGLAWLTTVAALAVWFSCGGFVAAIFARPPDLLAIALAPLILLSIYVGYFVFRTLGLLYRHRAARLPWTGQ